jgi:hypothetical protein
VLTKFICSLVIGISLLFIPQFSYADEVLIELTPDIAYVDVVVNVDTATAYVITTTTGPRTEIVDSVTVERVAWVDSWITLYRGIAVESGTVIAQDDDSNHNFQTNYYASALSGTLTPDTYTIRATSYDYIVAGQRPIGTYTLSSNLIPPPVDTSTVVVDTNTSTVDGSTATVDTSTPVAPTPAPEPPVVAPEPPPVIYIPPVVEPEPPVVIEEPPVEAEEPPVEAQEPPVESEEPPPVEEPPAPEEEAPAEAEEPLTPVEEAPPVVTEDSTPEEVEAAVEAIIEAADGEAITAEDIQEAGLTLEDLPSETPVEIRTDDNGNAVVITAEVAIALQVFDSPAELVSAIFDDPGQVLTAVANIGADMSDEERKESEEIIVASVIASQAAINAAGMAAGTATRIPTPSSPAGGPMAGNDKPKSTRRRKP